MYVCMYNMWYMCKLYMYMCMCKLYVYMCNICCELLGNQSHHRLSYRAVNHTSPALSPSVYMYTCIVT